MSNYKIVNLKDYVFFQEGPGIRSYEYSETGCRMINVKCVRNGHLDLTDTKYVSWKKINKDWKHFLVDENDILLTSSGTIGRVAKVTNKDLPLLMNTSVIRFKVLNNELLYNEYLKYYLSSNNFFKQLDQQSTQMCVKNVGPTHLKKMKLLLPSLKEQKRIVEILEKANHILKIRHEVNKFYKELIESIFINMFGDPINNPYKWDVMPLTNICSKEKHAIKAGPFGSSLKKDCYVEKGYKIYGQEQVIEDDLSYGDYYISEEKYKEMINYKVSAGDILISMVGSFGNISIVPENYEQGIINPRLLKITLDKNVMIPIFFKHLLLSPQIKKYLESLSHGQTMNILNAKILKNTKFIVPKLEVQKKYESLVNKYESVKVRMNSSEIEIKNLYNSLMQKYFEN